jgi:hypothetical protein
MLQNCKVTVFDLMSVRFTLTTIYYFVNPPKENNIRATLNNDIPVSVGRFSMTHGTLNFKQLLFPITNYLLTNSVTV